MCPLAIRSPCLWWLAISCRAYQHDLEETDIHCSMNITVEGDVVGHGTRFSGFALHVNRSSR